MSSLRFAMVLSLLYAFTVIAFEGPIIDPNGGRRRVTVGSHQGNGTGPAGRVHASVCTGDKGLGCDPNG
jgi:hypothetical protein